MNKEKAEELLKECIQSDGGLIHLGYYYISWDKGDKEVVLDGEFTMEFLEAVAWWVKNSEVK